MTRLLNEDVVQQVREVFAQLQQPVALLYFGQQENCDYCDETRQLLEEVAEISDQIHLRTYDLKEDMEVAAEYRVDKAPGIVIAAKEGDQIVDYGIRYAGIPSGHEFTSLIQDILMVGGRDSALSDRTREYLKSLDRPLRLQVFVTPTCPYCPRAVVLAHQMAMESPWVEAEMVEAMEFPELASRYGVSGVPHTTINDGAAHVVGAVPEDHLLAQIQQVMGA